MPRYSLALVLCAIGLTGCDQVTEMLEKGAEMAGDASSAAAGMTEDDKLGMKLDGYIGCINGASGSVLDSADRYASWVDIEAGVTGKEKNVYGLYDHELDQSCVDGINNANAADPDDPALEGAANAWLAAYQAIQPKIHDAYEYYDHEDYKDDAFAKAKEMHEGLASGFAAFQTADQAFRKVVSDKNDGLQERRLAQLEKEMGRKLQFQNANVMAKAKHLMEVGDVHGLENLDLAEFEKVLEAYDKAVSEAEDYVKANESEADSVMMFDSFVDSAEDYLKAAKELKRRKRDNKPYTDFEKRQLGGSAAWMVEGSMGKMSRAYNDLVGRSNGLGWHNYKPNG